MKRSEVNKIIEESKELLHQYNITLPPFGSWTPEDWKGKGTKTKCREIKDCMLGWDITDFGSKQFDKIGVAIFTLRNGHQNRKQYSVIKPTAKSCLLYRKSRSHRCIFTGIRLRT